MNKITIALVLGIFILGVAGAFVMNDKKVFAFGLEKEDFTEKVDKISAEKLCEKLSEKDKEKDKFKKCKDKDYDVDVPGDFIKQNEDGVYMIE